FIRAIDHAHRPIAILHARGRRLTALPPRERVAHGDRRQRLAALLRDLLLASGGHAAQSTLPLHQERVAPGKLPFPVRAALGGIRVADLDRPEHAARRAHEYRGVVFDALAVRPRAQLHARYFGVLPGEQEKYVDAMRAEIAQATAARDRRIEHPGGAPRHVARRGRPVRTEIEMRHRPE